MEIEPGFNSTPGIPSPDNSLEASMDNAKLKKERRWREIEDRMDLETDALGYGIEKGIKGTVVGLNALGVNTSQSCEGHVDEGRITPWVDVQAPNEPKKFIDEDIIYQQVANEFGISSEEVSRSIDEIGKKAWLEAQKRFEKRGLTPEYIEWLAKSKEEIEKVKSLVEEFNKGRSVLKNIRIALVESPYDATVYNGGKDYWSGGKDKTERQKKNLERRLEKYRTEFKDFALFLKEKFFIYTEPAEVLE